MKIILNLALVEKSYFKSNMTKKYFDKNPGFYI